MQQPSKTQHPATLGKDIEQQDYWVNHSAMAMQSWKRFTARTN